MAAEVGLGTGSVVHVLQDPDQACRPNDPLSPLSYEVKFGLNILFEGVSEFGTEFRAMQIIVRLEYITWGK